ncbi:MAG TPA: acetate--CoA ligase family protein [Firmicutes bacterium]|nr:acetate--CoA ligase family protein [Bacillota bacterium]
MLPDNVYKKLTAPESIALVGVTRRTGRGSNSPLEVLLKRGYQGRIYPVNPKGGEVLGRKIYTSLLDVPEVPDLAAICAPRDAVIELFNHCAAKGIKLVIIIAQGFFDGDEEGILMQYELLDLAAKNGIRVLGPNTLGIVNNYHNFCTSFIDFINPVKPVGITCQTGTFFVGASQLCTGIGVLVDSGNTTDISVTDVLGHLARDPRLKVINSHIESLPKGDGKRFMEAARDATKLKPVIVYKTGASPAGSLVAGSHTGRLAGEDRVFDAAFKQSGLMRVADIEEMGDLSKAFYTFDGIGGKRIGIISISGGAGVMAVDACIRYGLEIATPTEATMEQLGKLFPKWASCQNPMDIWPASMFHGYQNCCRLTLEAFLRDPQIDAVIYMTGSFLSTEDDFLDASADIREIAGKYPHKPVVVSSCGNNYRYYEEELEREGTVLYYFTLERAARALAALYNYHHLIKNKKRGGAEPAGQIIGPAGSLEGKTGNLSQTDAFGLLKAYGIPVARWGQAKSIDEALTLADEIGYPVTMKIVSPDIVHKSDVGGIKLDIRSKQQLEEAYQAIHTEVKLKQPAAQLEGVIIQEHLSGGIELLLGSKKDPVFGPVLAFGAGGIYAEVMDDISLRIPPLSSGETLEMIGETRISKILEGARGVKAVDKEQLVDLLNTFSRLALENPAIQEIDLNPLLAFTDRLVALDARVILA